MKTHSSDITRSVILSMRNGVSVLVSWLSIEAMQRYSRRQKQASRLYVPGGANPVGQSCTFLNHAFLERFLIVPLYARILDQPGIPDHFVFRERGKVVRRGGRCLCAQLLEARLDVGLL